MLRQSSARSIRKFSFEANKEGVGRLEEECRLEAFEKMLAAIHSEYADIVSRMEKLKSEDKVKSVTYKQLMARKLMYTQMLSMYAIYGLTQK